MSQEKTDSWHFIRGAAITAGNQNTPQGLAFGLERTALHSQNSILELFLESILMHILVKHWVVHSETGSNNVCPVKKDEHLHLSILHVHVFGQQALNNFWKFYIITLKEHWSQYTPSEVPYVHFTNKVLHGIAFTGSFLRKAETAFQSKKMQKKSVNCDKKYWQKFPKMAETGLAGLPLF